MHTGSYHQTSTLARTGWFLGPFLFVLIAMLGSSFGLGGPMKWAAATVLLMTVWWICEPIPLWLTACLPLLLFPVLGVAPLPGVALQYVDPVNFLFLGGMLIAACMQQWGLHRRIALEIIHVIGVSPRQIVLGFMLGTGFISLWISNTAAAMMMYPIGLAVLVKLREQPDVDVRLHARFGLALMLGIAYAASIGGIGTKIGTAPNLVFVKLAAPVMGEDVDFLRWLKVGLPIVVIALPLVWFYLVRIAAPLPASGFIGSQQVISDARAQMGPMHRGETAALVAFLTAAMLWIFRKDIDLDVVTIPGWWRLVTWSWSDVIGRPVATLPGPLAKMLSQDTGDSAVAMVVGVALLFIPISLSPLRTALSLRRAAAVPWGLLALLGGGFAMAYGIQTSGLSAWIGGWLQGLGNLPPLMMFLAVCFVTLVLTEVASNVATTNIVLPLIAASSEQLGPMTAPMMMAATCAASFGFMLPAGTPPNAIVYSSGYITVPQMARCGLVIDVLGAVLVAVVCWLLAPWALGVG